MLRALCRSQGELKTAQRKESKSPTNCLQCYSYSPQPHTSVPYVPSTQPHFPQRPGQEVHAGSSSHVSMNSYWEGSTAFKDVSFHRGHRSKEKNSWDPLLTMPPLGNPRTSWRWCQMRRMVRVGAGCPQSACACNSESSQVWARKTWQRTGGQRRPRDWMPT